MDVNEVEVTFGRDLIRDVIERTQMAIPQARVFHTMELAFEAIGKARRMGYGGVAGR